MVSPVAKGSEQALYAALLSRADENPLIQVELKPNGHASILLFGKVQKEVIADRLRREFQIEAKLSKTSPLFVQRPIGTGTAEQNLDPIRDNDFWATVELIVKSNPIGTGNTYSRDVLWWQMAPSLYRIIEAIIFATLKQVLHGGPKTCRV
ncbi:MAG: hypothetical protein HRU29_14115 [Rhizobiales bacterium]|nr:hypothetical protein [Hyphomicrobiales bacterium]NRB15530.1 hypothetical protein [Hyphomicrobiales bacterium]